VSLEDAVSPLRVLDHRETYLSIAPQQVDAVCDRWEAQLNNPAANLIQREWPVSPPDVAFRRPDYLAVEGAIPDVLGQRDMTTVARLGLGAVEGGKP
jgi:hypothetical protein